MVDPARKWDRYQAVEEVLRRFGVEASLLAPDPARPIPAIFEGWDAAAFESHRELLLDLIAAGRVIRDEGFTPDDPYSQRSRASTRVRHHLVEGYSIHEMLALVAHGLAVAFTRQRDGAASPLHDWLTTLEWGAAVYGAPAELEWASVDLELACRGPLERAALVKRLVWAIPFSAEDRQALEAATTAALRALAVRYQDAAVELRRTGSERAEELAQYAENLEEGAVHFWE